MLFIQQELQAGKKVIVIRCRLELTGLESSIILHQDNG